jgi:ERCC4-like helicases
VATSVAEEGLDIPSTDLVIFYEPVPSEIRSIQRRGRTGRTHAGSVKILLNEGTRDIGYYMSSLKKESKMNRNISKMNDVKENEAKTESKKNRIEKSLDDYF